MSWRGLLLDTHVFLWWRMDDARLGADVRRAIADADTVYVSAASAWEAAIKASLGKLELPDSVRKGAQESGFDELPIRVAHAEAAAALPAHHRDPFDRMLVAQALVEGLVLVTHDRQLEPYGVPVLWV